MLIHNLRERLHHLISWRIQVRPKRDLANKRSSSSNISNYSSASATSMTALKDSKKISRTRTMKVVRFAEVDGEVLTEVFENSNEDMSLDENIDEVYVKNGQVTGFIEVKNLEMGREVLVRYSETNWTDFKQMKPKRVSRIVDRKGHIKIKILPQRNGKRSRRRKQIAPCDVNSREECTYMFRLGLQKDLGQLELVVISSFNNIIDTNHKQCYKFCDLTSSQSESTDLGKQRREMKFERTKLNKCIN
ncbi:uncharacterized protein LOC124437062 isoform X3 [Xenia sp. Carnegie-2017]|nr:uncharacterized protein LOC124437062 isoform X3 [Xenia sp. Carnegie-2017]XP_046843041.1 uncharacterized protein LOC124437062 isoform X3 [Xenia sp. Carnegie-2017]XP_046843042.1 uncharacterized protein LOC124437062 isoform X3 [Xenia sp. Carnegie-2017]XP_046843043.1 uncharacterized protein LOC124437062 isoform X3 [Xenia sp. Carnegie-2017]XP_046843044.1 uncharacterized protein LOC124437062 isoform X3 [Xenia sp. Carnegie-2017]